MYFRRIAFDTKRIQLKPLVQFDIDDVIDVHMQQLSGHRCPRKTLIWPISNQQPTFDGLVVKERRDKGKRRPIRLINFFQVTIADTHAIDLGVLRDMMIRLNAQDARIYFVRPSNCLKPLSITPIENPAALMQYGWPVLVDDIRKRIVITTMDW